MPRSCQLPAASSGSTLVSRSRRLRPRGGGQRWQEVIPSPGRPGPSWGPDPAGQGSRRRLLPPRGPSPSLSLQTPGAPGNPSLAGSDDRLRRSRVICFGLKRSKIRFLEGKKRGAQAPAGHRPVSGLCCVPGQVAWWPPSVTGAASQRAGVRPTASVTVIAPALREPGAPAVAAGARWPAWVCCTNISFWVSQAVTER